MLQFVARKRTLVLAVLAAVGISVAAYAYWTGGGSGTGSATTGDVAGLTVNQTSSITGLYPGGDAQTLSGNFDNANDSAVKIGSVTAIVKDTNKDGCTADDFEIGGAAVVNAEVPKGTAQGSWTGLTVKMLNRSANQDACQGATVNIEYTATAAA